MVRGKLVLPLPIRQFLACTHHDLCRAYIRNQQRSKPIKPDQLQNGRIAPMPGVFIAFERGPVESVRITERSGSFVIPHADELTNPNRRD